jgi:hypothetical protein
LFVFCICSTPLRGEIKFIRKLRVPPAPLVQTERAVPNKLPHNKYGHFDVIGNGTLLEGAGMAIFVKIDEEFLVLLNSFAWAFVGNPC